jgi:two-component system response regulator
MAFILVIEQEAVLLSLISNTLRLDGHTIMETNDPIEALSIVNQRKQEIDLVLTGVDMSPISGFEFVKRINQDGVNISALFISAYPGITGVIRSILGERAVIEKPFTSASLRQSVARALAKRNRRSNTSGTKAA